MHGIIEEERNCKLERVLVDTQNGARLIGDRFGSRKNPRGILLFPGFSEHRSSLYALAGYLTPYFQVWVFDINQQGGSSGHFEPIEVGQSISFIANAFRARYSLEKLGGFGNSLGGMGMVVAAAEDPGCLDALCISTMPPSVYEFGPEVIRFLLKSDRARNIIKHTPTGLVRSAMIAMDIVLAEINPNYRVKTHAQFKPQPGLTGWQPYAQFGALKIDDFKDFVERLGAAPRMEEYVARLSKPTLWIYGGEAHHNDVVHYELPDNIKEMLKSAPGEEQRQPKIVPGADHSLNKKTGFDDCFNQDPEYQWVKEKISEFFYKTLIEESTK